MLLRFAEQVTEQLIDWKVDDSSPLSVVNSVFGRLSSIYSVTGLDLHVQAPDSVGLTVG